MSIFYVISGKIVKRKKAIKFQQMSALVIRNVANTMKWRKKRHKFLKKCAQNHREVGANGGGNGWNSKECVVESVGGDDDCVAYTESKTVVQRQLWKGQSGEMRFYFTDNDFEYARGVSVEKSLASISTKKRWEHEWEIYI